LACSQRANNGKLQKLHPSFASNPIIRCVADLLFPGPEPILGSKSHKKMENIVVSVTEKDFKWRPALMTIHVKLDVRAPDRASVREVDGNAEPKTRGTSKNKSKMRAL
jgi:hypothetical protein